MKNDFAVRLQAMKIEYLLRGIKSGREMEAKVLAVVLNNKFHLGGKRLNELFDAEPEIWKEFDRDEPELFDAHMDRCLKSISGLKLYKYDYDFGHLGCGGTKKAGERLTHEMK